MHALLRDAAELRFVMTTSGDAAGRSVAFYEALGFEVADDTELFDGSRWIEMAASGPTRGAAVITPGEWSDADVGSGFLVASRDTATLERALVAAGVSVRTETGGRDDDAPAAVSFWFEDPLGNLLLVSASSATG
jgi:catechol 2,3-dioxygenase-like lactoylglutathione lyase family enzyme